jgi:leucyl aminopeptidase
MSNEWLNSTIEKVAADSTAIVLVTEADCHSLGMTSEHFIADLKLSKVQLVYLPKNGQRCLLALVDSKADDSTEHQKGVRGLAKSVIAQLHKLKILKADIIASNSVPHCAVLVSHFVNQFMINNYERCTKREKSNVEDSDPRVKRVTKNVETFDVHCEDQSITESPEYKLAVARAEASVLAKHWGTEKGSVADPDWMEKQIRETFEGKEHVKEIRVIRGK